MEQQFIAWLRERLPAHPLLRLGPGDDAAVLRMAGVDECVITVDLLTEGVDFLLAEVDPRRVGRKALAVNLSDLAAMAARPLAAVLAVALPRRGGCELAVQLYEGILPLAEKYDLAIAGGDTNSWDGPLVITATLLGQVTARGPLLRKAPWPAIGSSSPGPLAAASWEGSSTSSRGSTRPCCCTSATTCTPAWTSATGLAIDLGRLVRESGVGAIVETDRVPIHDDARRLAARANDGRTPLEHALGDGEDFELLLAVPPDEARRMLAEQPLDVPLTDIGQFIAEPGLWQREADGPLQPLTPSGWEHRFS